MLECVLHVGRCRVLEVCRVLEGVACWRCVGCWRVCRVLKGVIMGIGVWWCRRRLEGCCVYGCWKVEVLCGVEGWRACRRWRMRGIRGAVCDRIV